MELKAGTQVELHTHDGIFEIIGQWPGGQWILENTKDGSEVWADVSEIKGALY